MWFVLAMKMAVTALVVTTATIVAERLGATVGALVATLPVSAGPVYVFLAIDHDAAFISSSATVSLCSGFARRRGGGFKLPNWSDGERRACCISGHLHKHHAHTASPRWRPCNGGRTGKRRSRSCRIWRGVARLASHRSAAWVRGGPRRRIWHLCRLECHYLCNTSPPSACLVLPFPRNAGKGTENYSAAWTASDKLSSEEMMCSASASASVELSCALRTRPMRQLGSSGNPSAAVSTRMPGRRPDSGSTDTARPASTAAATAPAFELE